MNHDNDIPYISDVRMLDIDTDHEWARFKAAAGISEPKTFRLSTLWKAAASIVLIAGASLLAYNHLAAPATETHVASQEAIEATVETSTQISLNRNSRITCTDNRKNGTYNVQLEGEAYFDVEKNPDRTFTIDTKDVTVTVRGTSFDVCEANGNTTVTVTSGNVEVTNHADNQTIGNLTRGKQLVCHAGGKMEVRDVDNFNCIAWKLRNFEFNDQTLEEIMKQLQTAYNFQYNFANDDVRTAKLTGTFDQQDIQSVFTVIEEALDITITQDADGAWSIGK
ncbi:MAG: FecR domain-containing protein [Bacteroidales bacterium]|jgi:ferric-dicitrate binding protein FerR (iron transport regulator)|nr:FecR domain-containing protein [Bacteroidales bacterium]MBQ5549762.1 FecR domain-containing protein [Bacteroidales bacterium]MBQ5576871.1 FecR domain-containing protein [Bacteroidales bacterium]